MSALGWYFSGEVHMPDFKGPMSAAEWSGISQSQKQEMIPAYHQSIIHSCADTVTEALCASINSLIERNINPNQALAIVAAVNDPALPFASMDAEIRKRLETKIGDLSYIVIANDRTSWTGGPGAPHWGKDHPYKRVMLELCKDPKDGNLWVVIFAGGGATAFQLSAQVEESMPVVVASGVGAEIAGSAEVVESPAIDAPATEAAIDAPATEASARPIDPFET